MSMKDLMPRSRGGLARAGADNPFLALQRDLDRAFEDAWKQFEGLPAFNCVDSPKIDVAETDDAIEATAELPGMEENDIDVSLSDDTLTIKGERKIERDEKKKDYVLSERSWGSFMRAIPLPATVQTDRAAAEFAKGVLTVTLPKAPDAPSKIRKIEVKGR